MKNCKVQEWKIKETNILEVKFLIGTLCSTSEVVCREKFKKKYRYTEKAQK